MAVVITNDETPPPGRVVRNVVVTGVAKVGTRVGTCSRGADVVREGPADGRPPPAFIGMGVLTASATEVVEAKIVEEDGEDGGDDWTARGRGEAPTESVVLETIPLAVTGHTN